MPEFIHKDIRVEIDDKGYLLQSTQWTPAVAGALASSLGIDELTESHWRVLNFLRQYHQAKGAAPMIRVLCTETGFKLKEIYELFPPGPTKGASLIAGLPRPDSCV